MANDFQPRPRPFQGPRRPQKEEPFLVNQLIKAARVRVVGENIEQGVYDLSEAVKLALAQGLDLVEISPNADPPVCRIVDYSKFKYEQKKKQKEIKAKAQKAVLKEIRFGPNTDEHDFEFKLKHAINFLKEGSKVKAYVQFSGREMAYKERGEVMLLKFAQGLEEYAKVEQMPQMEGRKMLLMLVPKPNIKK
ncbi:MAG: translation initiation factor IF-3 [Cytophagales bacterium]